MIRIIRLSLLAAAATALVACGSGPKLGGGKEGAAKAMFVASQNSNTALQRATGQALPVQALASYANTVGEFAVKCAKSGELKVKIDFLTYLEDIEKGEFKYEVEFNDCNEDGLNALDGKLAIEFKVVPGTIDVSLKFKGKIEFSGEVDDYIDTEVTLAVSGRGLDQTSGTVGITLTGKIKTSEETYTYDGSPLTITVEGGLPIANEGKP
jgi:hypothetical protein